MPNYTADFWSAVVSIVTNEGGSLNNENLVAQLAAMGAGDVAATTHSPAAASVAIMSSGVAFGFGLGVLLSDIQPGSNASEAKLIGDLFTVIGDSALFVGGIAQLAAGEEGPVAGSVSAAVGTAADAVGTFSTFVGLAASDFDQAQKILSSSPGLQILVNAADATTNEIQSLDDTLSNAYSTVSGALNSAWGSTETELSAGLNAASNFLSDEGDTNSTADANSAANDFSSVQEGFSTLLSALGDEGPDVTESASDNSVNLADTDDSVTDSVVTFTPNSDDSALDIGVSIPLTGNSSDTVSYYDNTSSALQIDQENGDGTSQITTFNSDGSSVTTDYSGADGTGAVTGQDAENADSSSQLMTDNPDGSSVTTYYAGPHGTGSISEVDRENADGTSQITIDTPGSYTTSTTTYYTGPDGTGSITEIDYEYSNGTSQVTIYNPDGSSVTTSYNGPSGTGTPMRIDVETDTASLIQSVLSVEYSYSGAEISGTVVYYPFARGDGNVGSVTLYYNGEEFTDVGGSLAVDAQGNVVTWGIEGSGPDGGVAAIGGSTVVGDISSGEEYFNPGFPAYSNPDAGGSWSGGFDPTTALDIGPILGQTEQLSDAVSNPDLTVQGPLQSITIDGPGIVEVTGVETIPDVVVDSGGDLVLQGTMLNTDPVTIDASGNISGYGTITGSERVNGVITAEGGTLDITGNVSGSGILTFDAGASLTLEGTVAATASVAFTAPNETLKLDDPGNFAATISGFVAGTTIDLAGISATGGTLATDNTLTVDESGEGTLSLNVLATQSSNQTVYAVPDGNGGTDLVLTEPVPVTTAPSSAAATVGVATDIPDLSVAIPGGPSVNEILTVVLSDSYGLLAATQASGGTVSGSGTQSLTLSGSLDEINAELASVTYTSEAATPMDIIDVKTSNDAGTGDDHKININQVDQENPNGTSQVTKYGPDGSSTTTTYSGPTGTGVVIGSYGTSASDTTGLDLSSLGLTYNGESVNGDLVAYAYQGSVISVESSIKGTLYYDGQQFNSDGSFIFISPQLEVENYLVGGYLSDGPFAGTVEIGAPGAAAPGPGSSEAGDGYEITPFENDDVTPSWGVSADSAAYIASVSVNQGQTDQLPSLMASLSEVSGGFVQTINITGPGTVELSGAASITNVEISSGANLLLQGGVLATDPVTTDVGGNITGYGTISGGETDNGTITASGGTLDITGDISGSGTLTFDAGASLTLEGTIDATESLDFTASNETLILGANADVLAALSGLGFGDKIALEGQQVASAIYDATSQQLAVTGNTGPGFDLNLAGTYQQSDFAVQNGEAVVVLCFLRGTQIATPAGEVPVEQLAIGDRVLTLNGAAQPIVWIGVGKVLATRGRRNAATPIIVRKGALADNVPHRDLRVTKGHSLFIDGVLIPVEFLVNHRSIEWDDRAQEVNIYHIELETHDVLIANGAPTETYRDDGNRWLFQNANTGWNLPPKEPCAPVLTGGSIVDAVWRRLLDRAGPRKSLPLTDDADLHVLVEGRRLDAAQQVGDVHVFHLPNVPTDLRIASRAAVPAELGLARDFRALGVALLRVVVRKGTRFRTIKADDARLSDGFHVFEPDNGFRWTAGDAAVPAELFAGFTGPLEFVLHVGATTRYLDEGQALRVA